MNEVERPSEYLERARLDLERSAHRLWLEARSLHSDAVALRMEARALRSEAIELRIEIEAAELQRDESGGTVSKRVEAPAAPRSVSLPRRR